MLGRKRKKGFDDKFLYKLKERNSGFHTYVLLKDLAHLIFRPPVGDHWLQLAENALVNLDNGRQAAEHRLQLNFVGQLAGRLMVLQRLVEDLGYKILI